MKIGESILDRFAGYMASNETVVMVVSGEDAIGVMKRLVGRTDPQAAGKGTIRGDFSSDSIAAATMERRPLMNIIHASDAANAENEIKLAMTEFGNNW
ncbi:nucleoside-diphosphate kinase [mine drainage metagenome]|uniref:nucleoside-diphosphate kinase n=1 Tax=mine drainage metagenome TaxID=410659 RepID=T0ZRY7_9ZZZZ